MDLCSAGFSLRVLAYAKLDPHKLKHALLKNKAPEGRPRGGKAVRVTLPSLGVMLGESTGCATSRQPPKRLRNHGETPSPHVASKSPACEATLIRESRL